MGNAGQGGRNTANESNGCRNISIGCLGIVVIFFILILSTVSGIANFIGGLFSFGSSSIKKDTDVTQTAVYQQLLPWYEEWKNTVQSKLDSQESRIIAENTELVETVDELGIIKYEAVVNVTVATYVSDVNWAYIFAYLTTVDDSIKTGKVYGGTQDDFNQFLNTISTIEIKQTGDSYYITNTVKSIEEIAAIYFPDQTELSSYFSACYSAYKDFFGFSGGSVFLSDVEIMENGLPIPLYYQYAEEWRGVAYGDGNIGNSACGPTCIAMVMSYFKGTAILPTDVVAWAGNRYYVNGAGSSWAIFGAAASNWGVSCTNIGLNTSQLVQALNSGKPVIASVRPGTFTTGGHFIVLRGITVDGRILVNDPNDNNTKNFRYQSFDLNLIARESKNWWVFSN